MRRAPGPAAIWAYFFLFALCHALLAHSTLSLQAKGWVLALGILLPWIGLACGERAVHPGPPDWGRDFPPLFSSPVIPLWIFAGAILLRVPGLFTARTWPVGDEGLNGFFAMEWAREWKWDFFITSGQLPPGLTWMLSPFFKFSKDPLLSLWILPALLSVAAVMMGYGAARLFFGRSFAGFLGILMTLGFWPLYLGRFCHQGGVIPVWECALLWMIAFYLKADSGEAALARSLSLGFLAGLGSFFYTSWPVMIPAALVVVLLGGPPGSKGSSWKCKAGFLLGLGVALAPFGWSVLQEGWGTHVRGASALSGWFGADQQLVTMLSFCTMLFWGSLTPNGSYGPAWGGMLNPFWAAAFWFGALELWKFRGSLWARWVCFAFLLTLLPGLLSADYVQVMRVSLAMPFVILIVGIGFQKLFQAKTKGLAPWGWALILVLSSGLEVWHLFGKALPRLGPGDNRDVVAYRAFQEAGEKRGDGILFTDFLPIRSGHTLSVMTYAMNAGRHPGLDPGKASWVGIVTQQGYRPFLSLRFPRLEWKTNPSASDKWAVGILPLDPENRKEFERWNKAHEFFRSLRSDAEKAFHDQESFGKALRNFIEGHSRVEGDRFLEACYWEWGAQFRDPTYQWNLSCLERAVENGYPAPHLYREWAAVLLAAGQEEGSRRMLRRAESQEKVSLVGKVHQ